ncbi:hypothetical protein DV733_12380 [Halapricum salinum]|uniref:Fenitrothion hydrolase n=1 Tax=Halapricum salinum TaxID=1457250 RepID=A0A4D6HGH0_9EURY|nr:hypothetical protein DV733_12380 [Halapricum salinum]
MVFGLVALFPGVASAHEVSGSRLQTPLPLSVLLAGAGVTVASTALWLAVTDRTPAATDGRARSLTVPASVARPLSVAVTALFLAGVASVLVFGFVGRQVAAENVATVFTWPLWFRGLALLALVFGTAWQLLSPWRAIYRGLAWLEGGQFAVLGTYPAALGAWPAVVGFVALVGITENLTVIPRSPRLTGVVVAAYGLAMVAGATLFGTAWLRHADPLGVFYRLFGRVAPLAFDRGERGGYTVSLRSPWTGCLDPFASVSLVVFAIATVYTVSFDGFTETRAYQTVLFDLRGLLGTGPETSILLYVFGLAGFVLTFAAASWAVERLGGSPDRNWVTAARWFAPTVLPIAGAYEVAHNYPYVIRNLGTLVSMSVPGVESVDVLGWLSVSLFWGSQVVLVVAGHVVAVVAAHAVARSRYDSPAAARRGHLPLVVLMIGYTVLSLWIISQPVVG